jgi:hypothetical protein
LLDIIGLIIHLIIKLAIAACRGIEKHVNKATFNYMVY